MDENKPRIQPWLENAFRKAIEKVDSAAILAKSDELTSHEVLYDLLVKAKGELERICGELKRLLDDKNFMSLECIILYLNRTTSYDSGGGHYENCINIPHAAWCLRKIYDDVTGRGNNTAGEFVSAHFDHNAFYNRRTGENHYSINLREGIIREYFKAEEKNEVQSN